MQAYISALEQGCRCVERLLKKETDSFSSLFDCMLKHFLSYTVDLWDGPNGDPIIVHGRTLTSEIMLTDVLNDAIKPYAFKASPYPLILSLECHLSDKQSKRLAFLLKDILGGSSMTISASF